MEQNKTRTYLLYALGEVMLVVIGILLALQINNLNLDRIDRQKEQEILLDLKVEFEANLNDLNRVIGQHKVIYSELTELQKVSISRNYDDPRLDSLTHSFIKWFTFTDRPGASTNLISSGNLNLIRSDSLRDLITQWSGNVNDVIDDEVYTADFVRETMLPFLAKHYPISNLEPQNKNLIRIYYMDRESDPIFDPVFPVKSVNWKSILENKEFQSLIALRKIYEMHCIMEGEFTEEKVHRILALIKQELDKT